MQPEPLCTHLEIPVVTTGTNLSRTEKPTKFHRSDNRLQEKS